jgi:pantoate--beta-alanine ligase
LTPEDRSVATVLSRALDAGQRLYETGETDAAAIVRATTAVITDEPRAALEYVELVDASTLRDVAQVDSQVALLTAARFGGVRLIDNHVFGG